MYYRFFILSVFSLACAALESVEYEQDVDGNFKSLEDEYDYEQEDDENLGIDEANSYIQPAERDIFVTNKFSDKIYIYFYNAGEYSFMVSRAFEEQSVNVSVNYSARESLCLLSKYNIIRMLVIVFTLFLTKIV